MGVTSLSVIHSPTSPPSYTPSPQLSEGAPSVKIEGGGSATWALAEVEPEPMAHVALVSAVAVDASASSSQERQAVYLEESKLFV